jgi:hypothetical protein
MRPLPASVSTSGVERQEWPPAAWHPPVYYHPHTVATVGLQGYYSDRQCISYQRSLPLAVT